MKTDFLLIGAQKSGTSALKSWLRDHPEICVCTKREAHFFDAERRFRGDQVDYGAYHAMFNWREGQRIAGESTPSYLYWKSTPERVARYNPEMKLICVLRNPVERAYSHWNMMRQDGVEKLSFSEAIRTEQERTAANLPLQNKLISYVSRGIYTEQLERWFALFPREQFLILKSNDLKHASEATLRTITRFLGVSPTTRPLEEAHVRAYNAPMPWTDRQWLSQHYRQNVLALQKLLDWDCSDWLATFTDDFGQHSFGEHPGRQNHFAELDRDN